MPDETPIPDVRALLHLTPTQRAALLVEMTPQEAEAHLYDWQGLWARPAQLPPPGEMWRTWLIMAGRGFGKTRSGAEWIRAQVESGRCLRLALIGPTAADVRDVMVEGESGLLAISPPWNRPEYQPSKRRVVWPNGAIATMYSADEPERLRGPQHDGGWCDEIGAWRYPEAWDMFQFGLRLGVNPRCVVTTTPRPTKLMRELLAMPTTVKTGGSTYENAANLADAFLAQTVARYEGTRLGRQELHAELLTDTPGALWKREQIEALRVTQFPALTRVVVAIDPAVTSEEGSDETGLIVAGLGTDGHGYVLDDRSLRASPDRWAREAVAAYHSRSADRIIAEVNNGGDLVALTLRTVDSTVSYKAVHASRGKQARAEPIAALYEQRRIHHVGTFPELEDQLTTWTQGESSPDRLDALVWAFTELMLSPSGQVFVASTRLHLSPEQRAIEDRAAQAERMTALQAARAALAAAASGAGGGTQTEDGASAEQAATEAAALEAAIAAAADEARQVVSVRSDGVVAAYESDAEREARLQNERQIAQNLRYLEAQFGLTPGGGFGGNEW